MIIDNAYELKQLVYLITDQEQQRRIITGITICMDGGMLYDLACGASVTRHYEAEISGAVNELAKL